MGWEAGRLLLIAERAIELVTQGQLGALVADIVQVNAYATDAKSDDAASSVAPTLLAEVRSFHHAAMEGELYEHAEINNAGRREQSRGTDAFIAEFDRQMRRCFRSSEVFNDAGVDGSSAHEVRDSFELLFALHRHIDGGNDDVLFFADDGSSLDVGVNWRVVLPAYFKCLAETKASSPEEFARAVDEAIAEFGAHDRPHYLDAARAAANDAQRVAIMSK